MKTPNWVDAQQMQVLHPRTFSAPSEAELAAITAGNNVKASTEGERFWIEVTKHEPPIIIGVVNNALICTEDHGLRLGDVVQLEERHVYDIC